MIGAAAAYMSGLFFASFFLDKYGAIAAVCCILLLIIYGVMKNFRLSDYGIIVMFFGAAVTVNLVYTNMVYDKIISCSGTEGSFVGEIAEYSVYDGDIASYTIKGRINGSQKARINLLTSDINADYGDKVIIEKCTFSEIESDYLFDSKTWNKSRHIYLEAEKVSGISVEKQDKAVIKKVLASIREKMVSRLCIEMDGETGSFLAGMIFGEKQQLDDDVKTSLYRCGIGHILAVSGLHVSVIAAVVMALLNRLKVNKYVSFVLMNVLLMFIIALTEYPVSAIRAVIMLEIAYSARLFGQQNDSLNSLSIAALLICITDCYAVYSSGFLLSVCGTFGAAVFAPFMAEGINRENRSGRALSAVVYAVCVSLAVMPCTMIYFDEVSLISPIANILLIPLCVISMLLGIVYLLSGGFLVLLADTAELLLTIVIDVSDFAAEIPFFTIAEINGFMPVILVISAGAAAAVYLFSENKKAVSAAIAIAVIVNTGVSEGFRMSMRNNTTIAVLEKGNTMASVVTCGGNTVVVDMKSRSGTEESVVKYLRQKGLYNISDLVICGESSSKYSAYIHQLEDFGEYGIHTIGEGFRVVPDVSDSDELSIESGGCTLTISADVLTVCAEGVTVVFHPYSYETEAELSVIYGNIPESDENRIINEIALRDTDSFEIIIKNEGKYKLRSL